jgi:glycyl-tRNA synthetase beta chain
MAELLLELLSEEIPARMQARAADDLKRLVCDGLETAELSFNSARSFVTPRRLALVVDGLPVTQPDRCEEKKGPRVGAPDQAVQGFLKSAGYKSLEECEIREIKGTEFYFAISEKKGHLTTEVLPELFRGVFEAFPWPKSMRWGTSPQRWVRPLHGILCVFDGKIVGDVSFGNKPASNMTEGHRFLSLSSITITDFADYEAKLEQVSVMLDPARRRETILRAAENLARKKKLTVWHDDALLDEVTGLVEWPVVLMGSIDQDFMDLPPEVLTTSMRHHQKYFSLLDADGNLAPYFIMVAATHPDDKGKAIIAGNERVLRARLSDARFFWDQDRKDRLEAHLPTLADVVFHAKLGSLADKAERLGKLAAELAIYVPGAEKKQASRAARLAKVDLVTGMVGEFPELQGTMGCYYASHDGEPAQVCDAITDHYAPAGPSEDCPTEPVSVTVALADKIDTLVGFFAIGEPPTGSKDPFALRRAALGVIRLILENHLRIPLATIFSKAASFHGKEVRLDPDDLLVFFADRLKVHLKEKGVRHDLIFAVFALGGEDDLVRLMARVEALSSFLESDNGANLLTAFNRVVNIVAIEEKKDGKSYGGKVNIKRLEAVEEKALSQALGAVEKESAVKLKAEDFTATMTAMATLRPSVDTFFDHVTINCEDAALRANRLRLLSRIGAVMGAVADFSKIEG